MPKVSHLSLALGLGLLFWPVKRERATWLVKVGDGPAIAREVQASSVPVKLLIDGLEHGELRPDVARRAALAAAFIIFGIPAKPTR